MADEDGGEDRESDAVDPHIQKEVAQKMHRLDLLNANNSDNDTRIFRRDRLLTLNAVLSCGLICVLLELDYEWAPSANTTSTTGLEYDEWIDEYGGSTGLVPGRFISTNSTFICKGVLSLLTIIALLQVRRAAALAPVHPPAASCPRAAPLAACACRPHKQCAAQIFELHYFQYRLSTTQARLAAPQPSAPTAAWQPTAPSSCAAEAADRQAGLVPQARRVLRRPAGKPRRGIGRGAGMPGWGACRGGARDAGAGRRSGVGARAAAAVAEGAPRGHRIARCGCGTRRLGCRPCTTSSRSCAGCASARCSA